MRCQVVRTLGRVVPKKSYGRGGAGGEQLDLVAVEGPRILGHVLGAYGRLGDRAVVGIAPLSVVTDRQNEGIGSAVMTELLGRIEGAGAPLVVLLGLPG